MARIVPMGIERWASFRSPERFEPAMIPGKERERVSKRTRMSERLRETDVYQEE